MSETEICVVSLKFPAVWEPLVNKATREPLLIWEPLLTAGNLSETDKSVVSLKFPAVQEPLVNIWVMGATFHCWEFE